MDGRGKEETCQKTRARNELYEGGGGDTASELCWAALIVKVEAFFWRGEVEGRSELGRERAAVGGREGGGERGRKEGRDVCFCLLLFIYFSYFFSSFFAFF